jgi:hypothetical protein
MEHPYHYALICVRNSSGILVIIYEPMIFLGQTGMENPATQTIGDRTHLRIFLTERTKNKER